MDLGPGGVFAGYSIVRRLGAGGMGAVYLARHPRLDRMVALKVLFDAYAADPGARAAFDRETRLATLLDHPNIVTVHDRSAPGDPALWLSMQHIGGGDAATLIAGHPSGLPVERALRLVTDAAHALDYAHAHGVLHRDVKPANLLIEHDPRYGERAVLTDFGIARSFDDTHTRSRFAATFAYTAPERFRGRPADHRSDIYSLGCTLFELLTGRKPFQHNEQAAIMAAHLMDPPPSVHRLRAELPPGIDAVIAKVLAKNPEDRYYTCIEFVEAVRTTLGTSMIRMPSPMDVTLPPTRDVPPPADFGSEPAPTPKGRVARVLRRRVVVLGVALAVVLGGGIVAWQLLSSGSRDSNKATPPAAIASAYDVTTIRVGNRPGTLAIDPAAQRLYVGNLGDGTISVIDTGAAAVQGTITGEFGLQDTALDADAHLLYSSDFNNRRVTVIDLDSRTVAATISIPGGPVDVAVNPLAHLLYVLSINDGGKVTVVDTVKRTVSATIPVGNSPSGIALYNNLYFAWVALSDGRTAGSVVSIDASLKAVGTEPLQHAPSNMVFSVAPETGTDPDSLYMANPYDNSVTVMHIDKGRSTNRIPVGTHPSALTIDSGNRTAYVVNAEDNSVSVIDIASETVRATIPVGNKPDSIAVDNRTHIVYCSNSVDNTVSVIKAHSS